jgi:hypothetical protein
VKRENAKKRKRKGSAAIVAWWPTVLLMIILTVLTLALAAFWLPVIAGIGGFLGMIVDGFIRAIALLWFHLMLPTPQVHAIGCAATYAMLTA